MTKNARRHIGETVTIRWGTSRGRNSYGYTTCSLSNHTGQRIAACNGGGYDMRGTVVGNWISNTFRKELLKLKPDQMPEHDHWERAQHPRLICRNAECIVKEDGVSGFPDFPFLPPGTAKCPNCGNADLDEDNRDGKRVSDGRYFYGLTFHDPNYDAGKAVIGTDCTDRTLGPEGESIGKTVAEREAAGVSVGLERYQAIYRASSKFPTSRHTVPSIDGACGLSSVLEVLRAIRLDLRQIVNTSKMDVYEIVRAKEGTP